jgi:hypothetical protein
MKKHVFIVTNDEEHWRGVSDSLKEKGISFYPETKEDFDKLRSYCHLAFGSTQEQTTKGEAEIKKIISKFPKKYSCIIRFQITEGDVLERGILFSSFYEKFLINYPEVEVIAYVDYGGGCICGGCILKKKAQETKALDYCTKKGISFYYWAARGPHFFVKDKHEFLTVGGRKELSIDMLLT